MHLAGRPVGAAASVGLPPTLRLRSEMRPARRRERLEYGAPGSLARGAVTLAPGPADGAAPLPHAGGTAAVWFFGGLRATPFGVWHLKHSERSPNVMSPRGAASQDLWRHSQSPGCGAADVLVIRAGRPISWARAWRRAIASGKRTGTTCKYGGMSRKSNGSQAPRKA